MASSGIEYLHRECECIQPPSRAGCLLPTFARRVTQIAYQVRQGGGNARLEIEKNGEVFYNAAAARSADPEVKVLFEDLAVQEQAHYRVFERMLGGLKPAPALPAEDYD